MVNRNTKAELLQSFNSYATRMQTARDEEARAEAAKRAIVADITDGLANVVLPALKEIAREIGDQGAGHSVKVDARHAKGTGKGTVKVLASVSVIFERIGGQQMDPPPTCTFSVDPTVGRLSVNSTGPNEAHVSGSLPPEQITQGHVWGQVRSVFEHMMSTPF